MYKANSLKATEFIDDGEIRASLAYAKEQATDTAYLNGVLDKASEMQGLTHREAMSLLESEDEAITKRVYEVARQIKQRNYGNRVVMFAPLYLSNHCINGCVYCPYHGKNKSIARKKLTETELIREVNALQDMGHKRLALESGEHPTMSPIEYILDCIKTIYAIKHKRGAIRRVNVNIAGTTVENYRKLSEAGIGTYILFQETYNKASYEVLHPYGPKSDYEYHTESMDRAMQGGISDVGIGVLYGLEHYKYDFVGLLMHAEHLELTYGVGPHTISVPRIRPASEIDVESFDNGISEDEFTKIVAVLRVAVPYTGLIISTRESAETRARLLEVGVSQLSGGSRTSVGGYADGGEEEDSSQFEISDNRTLDEIVGDLLSSGYMPSFCTACYAEGRVGDRFMRMVKSGAIAKVCGSNAILTLQEYLIDYASEETRAKGEQVILRAIEAIESDKLREFVIDKLAKIKQGERDFRV